MLSKALLLQCIGLLGGDLVVAANNAPLMTEECSSNDSIPGTCASKVGRELAKAPVLMQLTAPSMALMSHHRGNRDAQTPSAGLIKHRHGRCLDSDERNKNGGNIHMWSCDRENKNQQWTFNAATGQIRNLHGICLDSYEKKDGGEVHMWDCNADNENQKWTYDSSSGLIKDHFGFCLDAPESNSNHGKVHMWSCKEEEKNQHWDLEAAQTPGLTVPVSTSAPPSPSGSGWQTSGDHVGHGWCKAQVPADGWTLHQTCNSSGTQVKVLSYNLFWWNLFGRRGGNGGSAGKLIARNGPYDLMGFQECDDIHRVLRDAGLSGSYGIVSNLVAYKKYTWESIADTYSASVAEDGHWGGKRWKRSVHYARLRHKATGKVVFFANLHGPLPVNSGGICGQEATAYNILRVIAEKAYPNDVKIFIGDLNADANSKVQDTLGRHMHRIYHHWVDAIFSSCPGHGGKNLGSGGSDHDALEATFDI